MRFRIAGFPVFPLPAPVLERDPPRPPPGRRLVNAGQVGLAALQHDAHGTVLEREIAHLSNRGFLRRDLKRARARRDAVRDCDGARDHLRNARPLRDALKRLRRSSHRYASPAARGTPSMSFITETTTTFGGTKTPGSCGSDSHHSYWFGLRFLASSSRFTFHG